MARPSTPLRASGDSLEGSLLSGRYRVVEKLASGALGAVYRAEHVHMHKMVAVKVLHRRAQQAAEMVARFQREAMVGAHVSHPNIAAATDFGVLEDGSHFLVLEYIRGQTLREAMGTSWLPQRRAADIARQIASGLEALHEKGVVHRDLKPTNVMLVDGDRDIVKLIDFGFAKVDVRHLARLSGAEVPDGPPTLTKLGVVFGTMAYLPPEARYGMEVVDRRGDLYSLGIMLYEMLVGQRPFEADTEAELFRMHVYAEPAPFARVTKGRSVLPALEHLTMQLLRKAAQERPQHANVVRETLERIVRELPDEPSLTRTGESRPYDVPGPGLMTEEVMIDPSSVTLEVEEASDELSDMVTKPYLPSPAEIARALDAAKQQSGVRPLEQVAPQAPATAGEDGASAVFETSAARKKRVALVIGGVVVVSLVGLGLAMSSSAPEAEVKPPVSASAPPPPPAEPMHEGKTAKAWASELASAASGHDGARGAKAIVGLSVLEPARLVGAAEADVVSIGSLLEQPELSREADEVYAALAAIKGPEGADAMFAIARSAQKGGQRARQALKGADVQAKMSAAVRAAVQLGEAPCKKREPLVDEVAKVGDERALQELEAMRAPECLKPKGCCFKPAKKLDEAIAAARSRPTRR